MMRKLLAPLLVGVLLTGCVSTPDPLEKDKGTDTIPSPYGAKEFCKDNAKSELCVEARLERVRRRTPVEVI